MREALMIAPTASPVTMEAATPVISCWMTGDTEDHDGATSDENLENGLDNENGVTNGNVENGMVDATDGNDMSSGNVGDIASITDIARGTLTLLARAFILYSTE
ncbi:hypothetical protein DVH05_017513 [Phytophthora capsici]|nr:hypothetical protein DVH05_017513 [Phytophthora capsici]